MEEYCDFLEGLLELSNSFYDRAGQDEMVAITFDCEFISNDVLEIIDYKGNKIVFQYDTGLCAVYTNGKRKLHRIM